MGLLQHPLAPAWVLGCSRNATKRLATTSPSCTAWVDGTPIGNTFLGCFGMFWMCLQWNRMQELHIDRSQPLLNRFIVKIRMECIFFVAGHRSRPTSFTTCSRDLGVSHLIATWKSPKEPYQTGMIDVRNDICNGWTYELQSNAGEFDSVVSSFNSHLSASAKGSLIVSSLLHHHFWGHSASARFRFQTSRAGQAHPKKDWLIAVPYYLVDPEVKAPESEWVRDWSRFNLEHFSPTRLYFLCIFHFPLRFHEVRLCRTCWTPRTVKRPWVPSSNVGEDGLDYYWRELWTIKHSDLMGLLQWTGQGCVPQSLAPSTFKFNWSESFWNRFQITQISTKSFNKSGVFRFVPILSYFK